jgi:hypothetical protein
MKCIANGCTNPAVAGSNSCEAHAQFVPYGSKSVPPGTRPTPRPRAVPFGLVLSLLGLAVLLLVICLVWR